jgi:hypothetical protein
VNDDLPMDGLGELPDDLPDPNDPTAVLLRTVLHREADAVEPSPDGYARIRAEIERRAPGRTVRTARTARRLTPLLAAAAALVVVATAGTVAVRSLRQQSQAHPASRGVTVRTVDNDVRETPASALPVYVAARQNKRVVLFREFRRSTVHGVEAKVEQAVTIALTGSPLDPDHTQLFARDPSLRVRAHVTDTSIVLALSRAPRPADPPTPADAEAAVQQLVWTATAAAAVAAPAVQQPRSVTITVDGAPPALFGLARLDRTLTRTVDPDPRAPVWIDLSEGQVLGRGILRAGGDGTDLGGSTIRVVLRNDAGVTIRDEVVPLQRTDPQGTPLGPVAKGQRGQWSISGWPIPRPGTYTLFVCTPADVPRALIQDPATLPAGTWWDSRTFVVK